MTLPARLEAMLKQVDQKYTGFDPVGANLVKATAEKTMLIAIETYELMSKVEEHLSVIRKKAEGV